MKATRVLRGFWYSLPVFFRAVITGVLVTAAGTLPWAFLVELNIKYIPEFPWAVLLTAVYLWFYWKYVRGFGWPQSTSENRRQNCRAFNLSDEVWPAAIVAGILGLVALVLFQNVYGRMVTLPVRSGEELANVPGFTLFISFIMSALVAGVTEESGMRGYMQGPLETQYGPSMAILVTSLIFGLSHFGHKEVTIALLPWYMGVGLVYGLIAYFTGSILPGVVLHAGGNMLGAFQLLSTGRDEWHGLVKPSALIWETGADASFWLSVLAFAVIMAATAWAYAGLARVTRTSKPIHP